MNHHPLKLLISLSSALFFLVSCGNNDSGSSTSESVTPVLPYCDTVSTYSDPITITGAATYQYRNNGNGSIASPKPIRFAEIRVIDTAGTIIQCGETSATGTYSLSLPNNGESATIQITSRASNSQVNSYVLNNPTNNSFHALTTTFTMSTSQNIPTFNATADGEILGGAFNILDQIIDANDFLRTNTTNCNATFSECQPVTVAPLVTVYWTKGFNPSSYFGGSAPLSFYLPGDRQLYILGGVSGDVNSSDTDHFDNSIILHEYAHFLEDVYSSTDSPGGSHNGNSVIDARLAWGEGWANFFQAAVTGQPFYLDTSGTLDGTAQTIFNEPIETPDNDIPTVLGQGIFREFSVSRTLWDIIDSVNEGAGVDTITSPFSEIWTLFNGASNLPHTSRHFRSMALLHDRQIALTDGAKTDWSSVRTGELHKNGLADYGNTLTLNGVCGATRIQAANISLAQTENGSFANSNQFSSNDFYQYNHPGGAFTLSLSYTTNSANPADIDLFLYDNDYTFGNSSDIVSHSENSITIGQGSGSESISVSNLPAGFYMINILVYTGDRLGDFADYTMTLNGQLACPD